MPVNEEYFNSEDFQELLNSYEASMNDGTQPFMDADSLVDIADYYNMHGNADKALNVIEYALELYPHATLPNVFMARHALMQGDFQQAHEYASHIEERDDPDYHYLQAEILIAEGHIDEADRYLRDYGMTVAIDEYEDFIKDCANLYVDYSISDKAYEWMMRSKGDDSTDFKELMARTLFGLERYKDSERIFNELLDTDPYSAKYWKALAGVQLMAEDYGNALTSSEYAIAIDPDDSEGILCKANALLQLNNYEEAEKYFRRYTESEPDNESGLFHQGLCLIYMGKHKEALQVLQQAEQVSASDPLLLATIYQEQALCYSSLKQPQKAIEMLDKAIPMTDDQENLLFLKGHIMLQNDLLREAGETWKEAITRSNSSPAIIMCIVSSLYENHYIGPCYIFLKQFHKTYENDDAYASEGYSYLALCCHDLGHQEKFLKYLQKAVERDHKVAKSLLGFLFPPDTDVSDYYNYMSYYLNQ